MKNTQYYKGKPFKLHRGERYLSNGNIRMHRYVYEQENNVKIPKGFHVHHKNGDGTDNRIENLELVSAKEHQKRHFKIRMIVSPEWFEAFKASGKEEAKIWHKSEEGHKWHVEHAKNTGFGSNTFGVRTCPICGKETTAKSTTKIYCSRNCKAKARRQAGTDNEIKKCKTCGCNFETNKYSPKKYCSHECRVKS